MADSKAASDSIAASVGNGFDPPDVPSTSVSNEKKDGEGDVSGISKKDAEEKSVEEVKGVVVEGNGVEDLKDVEKVKDVENEKSVEIIDNVDEKKDLGSTKDDKDKRDVDDIKELVESEHGEEKEDARVTNEKKGVGQIVCREGHDDVNDAKDGEEKKDAGEASEIEVKSDVVELLEGQKDAKEANEDDKNKEVVKAFDEEEQKGFGETKDDERKKLDGETKHDEHKIALEERMDAEENDSATATEDIGGKNNLQASGNVKDNGEKNYLGDVKGSEQIQVVDGEVHKVDNVAEQLKYGKNKLIGPGIKDDEHKRDLGGENDLKNNLKPVAGDERLKVKKRSKDIEKVEAEVGKKKVVDEKDEVAIRGLTDEKDIAKEVHISEEEDAAAEEDDDGDIEKKNSSKKVAKSSKRKRSREQRSANKGEVKDKSRAKGKKESGKKTGLTGSTVDAVSSPMGSSRERPVRERKTVERLVEVIEKEPNKAVIIEKGRGTPLKDIPNVAYKLARKKPADLKFLHQTLFGRRGKVVDFKSNILQFSGFAWHEAEEKQRAKIKEKLDKCIKDNLLDLCDLFDLSVSKTNTKKEEIIVKLVDFLEAPHATTDVILADREQSEKSRKRKQFSEGSGSRSSGGTPAKRSRKRSAKAESTPKSSDKNPPYTEDDEEENTENGVPHADDAPGHSESDVKENELSESSNDEGENDDNDELGKGKNEKEQSPKNQGSAIVEKRRTGSNNKQVSSETQAKSPVKPPPSYKQSKAKKNDTGEKVFTRKKKKGSESSEASDDEVENEDVDELGKSPKNHGSSISKKRKRPGSNSKKSASQTVVKSPVKTAAPSSYKPAKVEEDAAAEKVFTRKKKDSDSTKKLNSKLSVKDNSSGKKSGKGKATGEERKSAPTKADLRKTICEILKEVDFNTATFTDILKNLATHYKMDLTPKKSSIKQMIQEELTKMADEAEDSEDGEKEEIEKEENPKPVGKKVKA